MLFLLSGCFEQLPDQEVASIHKETSRTPSDPSGTMGEAKVGTAAQSDTTRLQPEQATVNFEEILASHTRLRQIMEQVIKDPVYLTSSLRAEFTLLLGRIGPFASEEALQNFKDSMSGVLTIYKQYFYEDALASLKSGESVKSGSRADYEKHLIDLGGLDEGRIKDNDRIIARIAAKLPIPYNEEGGIVIDEAILLVLLANQIKSNQRLEALFEESLLKLKEQSSSETDSSSTQDTQEDAPGSSPTPAGLSEPTEASPASTILPTPTPAPTSTPTPEPTAQPTNKPSFQQQSGTFGLGSSAEEVEEIMGKPDTIRNYKYVGDDWKYGQSSVRFDKDFKVNGYINADNDLKVWIGNKTVNAAPFYKGASRQQVLDVMGTPDAVYDYKSDGSSWSYGDSKVDFNTNGQVKGWINSDDNLRFTNNP